MLTPGLAATSCTYALSFAFASHTKAQIVTVLANVFLGLFLMIAQFMMAQFEGTQAVNAALMPLYRLSPGFCLGHGPSGPTECFIPRFQPKPRQTLSRLLGQS